MSPLAIVLGLMLTGQNERLQMKVILCDQIGLNDQTWLIARTQASRIFANAGVDIVWLDPARGVKECKMPAMGDFLAVFIARQAPKGWTTPDAMGFAPEHTSRAYVFYELAERFVDHFRPTGDKASAIGVVLGHAIAHEFGHLLIHGNAHGLGVMQPHWSFKEGQQAFEGTLLFTPDHARAIQRASHDTAP